MRLINTKTYDLEDFSLKPIPAYAILSHTWGDDEVTYQDMYLPSRTSKNGWNKIDSICRISRERMLDYAWVDTCCIDKTSSAELTESINSMFQWYGKAYICVVFLSDLTQFVKHEVASVLTTCRWWTRGWTLQELIAPRRVDFYNMTWKHVGSRESFSEVINTYTKVPSAVLGNDSALHKMSVAARMSWAATRETTRTEDMAYCLLGIFDVNMPLIYGEGDRAFRRLQEEIVKRNSDLSIFACEPRQGLFAESARAFTGREQFERYPNSFLDFSVTNRGLRFSGQIPLRFCKVSVTPTTQSWTLVLFLGNNRDTTVSLGVCLRKIGPKLFRRDPEFSMVPFHGSEIGQRKLFYATNIYIITDWDENKSLLSKAFRMGALHVPEYDALSLEDAVPEMLWDPTDRIFLKPQPYKWTRYQMVLAMRFTAALPHSVELIVLCDARKYPPRALITSAQEHSRVRDLLFRSSNLEDSMSWLDLEMHVPSIRNLSDIVNIDTNAGSLCVSVSLCRQTAEPGSPLDVVVEVIQEHQ